MIWKEIKNDFEHNGVISIDAWKTSNSNEEGKVIAKVFKNEQDEIVVNYLDERAKEDAHAQEVIQKSIRDLKERREL